jgi:succinyl-diaminopimelate desuccinylase
MIGEPGEDKVSIAHRGLYRFRLRIQGEATHTGLRAWEQGQQGRNAILDMVRIALALSEHSLPQTHSEAFPDRKSVLTFPTLIHGGSGINIVPDFYEVYGDVRLLPGLSADVVKPTIQEHLTALSIEDYRLDDLIVVPAAETSAQAEMVRTLATSIEAITGTRPRLEGSGPAYDGWMFLARGIPTVCGYGVTCGGAHGADWRVCIG